MIASGFCSHCGERRDSYGCSCSPLPESYSYLSTWARRGGGRYYQAMHSAGSVLSAAFEDDEQRARKVLSHWANPRFGGIPVRAEAYDGDSDRWVLPEAL